VQETARVYAQDRLDPEDSRRVSHEGTDPAIFREMGELGLLGSTIDGYGCPGVSYVSYGLIAREIERVDSGYRSMLSVQSSLVMHPIHAYGTEAQREKYLPRLARGELDRLLRTDRARCRLRSGRHAHARAQGRRWLRAAGTKMWISNAPIADVFVVWAKCDDGRIRGFVLEKGMKGLSCAEDRGQAQPARLDHRSDRDGRRRGRCRATAAGVEGLKGAVRLPEQRALRHRVGRARCRRGVLARGAQLHARAQASSAAAGGEPAGAEEARRHADRDQRSDCRLPAGRPRLRDAGSWRRS
jgi:hypothetical protein